MNNAPLVTVIVASYNYGSYLAEALQSILRQSHSHFEVIVIDDGSTDDSVSIARDTDDARVTVVTQANQGIVAVRNKGIEDARGDYIVFLDADDILPPDYLQSNISFLEESGADIASTDLVLFGDTIVEHRDVQPDFDMDRMKQGNIVHISSMIRRASIGENRFDPDLSGRTHEDWDFFMGMALKGAVIRHNPETALMYRQHEGSRNNHEDNDQKKFEYARVYRDIIHKYALRYPDQLSYLTSTRFANFITYLEDVYIPDIRSSMSDQLRDVMKDRDQIVHTKEYRVGAYLLKIPRTVLSFIRSR